MDRFLPRLGVILAAAVLTACQANPGPPPVVDEDDRSATPTNSSTTTPPPEEAPEEDTLPKRSTVAIGVDPLRGGLNPHLVANNSELVNQIAELVLPFKFFKSHKSKSSKFTIANKNRRRCKRKIKW